MRSRFKSKFFLLCSFILLLIAACSSVSPTAEMPAPAPTLAPSPTATSVPTVTPSPTPAVSPPPSGKAGGSLTVAGLADIPHRDVHQEFQETLTALGPGLAYSRLLRLSTDPNVEQPSLLLECDLCQSWQLTEDFAYEFQLRPNVRWQNIEPVNGRELVADDLVYSYQRLQTPGWPNASRFSDRGIKSFEAPDPHTLRVNLAFLDSDALLSLADGHSKVVAREVVEQYGDLKDSPVVGAGPWIWEDTRPGIGTALSRNPDYFEEGLPFLDKLDIKVIKPSEVDATAAQERLAAFQTGLVDALTLPPDEWRQLDNSNAEFNSLVSRQSGNGVALAINVQAPPFDDVAVRRAFFKALDPWEYVDLLWAGQGSVSAGVPAPSPDWLLTPRAMRNNYLANPSKARDLLVGAGQRLPLNIELTVGEFGGVYLELGRKVAEDLRAVGFNPTIRALHPSHYNELLLGTTKDYQVILGAVPPASTPNGFLLGFLHSGGPANITGHHDSALDAMIEQQAAELDPDIRREQFIQIQRYILDQAYMFSPVADSSRWVFDEELKGFYPNPALSEYIHWSRAWLEE